MKTVLRGLAVLAAYWLVVLWLCKPENEDAFCIVMFLGVVTFGIYLAAKSAVRD